MKLQGLYLAGTGLIGELPEWLSSTSSLFFLDLSSNKKLIGLGELDLHSNNFTGGLSSIFTKAMDGVFGRGRYSFIDLSYNRFVGGIDTNIGNQKVMEFIGTLVLSNNNLGGRIPVSLGKLSQLRTLKLAKNNLIGTIPEELSNTRLTSIVLSNNKLTGGIPSGVINLFDLVEFDVSYNNLTGKIPTHKATLPASSFKGNPGLCGSPLAPCKSA
ncbi:hypothetical protein MKW94_020085 [Papaver nudicaule]|uniref:Uncharacterized protein n=1 Tax=Papaver nudicaule TaxID=74823 RepID=A0AA41RZ70_PAPNU|nr:hypothetical protein [Papaver nudicaule]